MMNDDIWAVKGYLSPCPLNFLIVFYEIVEIFTPVLALPAIETLVMMYLCQRT